MSTSYFVASDWLAEHISDPDIQILDARMPPPGVSDRDIPEEYRQGHLPGALFFDIEALSDATSPYPHMMPRPENFAVAMRELGVDATRHLIIYDEGNLFSAPRAWWMLRTFGAENVSILAGGLAGWKREGLLLESGEVKAPESEFTASFDSGAIKRLTDVLVISHEGGDIQLVDARPANRFNAEVDEPRPGLLRGHIPGARNVPWNSLVDNGELRTLDELASIFHAAGVDIRRPVVASCGSGVTAAVVVLALATLGATDVTLYDGSWGEWGSRPDLPREPA